MFFDEFYENKYNATYERVYRSLSHMREHDPKYGIKDLEALLESLYVIEGNDWTGRGELKGISNTATIAACEQVLAEWREIEEHGVV